eukprot:gene28048-34845_t
MPFRKSQRLSIHATEWTPFTATFNSTYFFSLETTNIQTFCPTQWQAFQTAIVQTVWSSDRASSNPVRDLRHNQLADQAYSQGRYLLDSNRSTHERSDNGPHRTTIISSRLTSNEQSYKKPIASTHYTTFKSALMLPHNATQFETKRPTQSFPTTFSSAIGHAIHSAHTSHWEAIFTTAFDTKLNPKTHHSTKEPPIGSTPVARPSAQPTLRPSTQPSAQPSCQPTCLPTMKTASPTLHMSSLSQITTHAGIGAVGFSGDGGPATSAGIGLTRGVWADTLGNMCMTESSKERMRKIDAGTSTISTVINKSGDTGLGTENGPATSAKMYDPTQIVGVGNYIYIADYGNDRVRVLNLATNIITTVVGRTMTNSTSSGDGGPVSSATLYRPNGIWVTTDGTMFIGEYYAFVIRRVAMDSYTSGSAISTIVGQAGAYGSTGDNGPASSALIPGPGQLYGDSSGLLYITCLSIRRVRVRGDRASYIHMHE